MNRLIFIVGAALSAAAFAADDANAQKEAKRAKRIPRSVIMNKVGGFITDTRAQKGRLVVVNAQKEADEATVGGALTAFNRDLKIRIDNETGVFDLKNAKRVGDATVYVISDDSLPPMIVAADDRWGFVNVAKLRSDNDAFFKARVRKEMVRVAGFVLGAGDSALYPMALTGQIKDLAALDAIPSEQLPNDVLQRVIRSMAEIGVTPSRQTTYRTACREGWAPPPTNALQKTIWEEVHSIPDKPMKIEFDPATQKGKVTK